MKRYIYTWINGSEVVTFRETGTGAGMCALFVAGVPGSRWESSLEKVKTEMSGAKFKFVGKEPVGR